MKRITWICILLGISLLVTSIYLHLYETRSTGLLPYIDYPLRPYALPIAVLGIILFVSGIILRFYRET